MRRIDTQADADSFLGEERIRVVGTDDGTHEGTVALLLALESAAAAFDEKRVVFGVARTPAAAGQLNLTGEVGGVALYKSYEEGRVALPRPVTAGGAAAGAQRLKEWVGSHLRPAMVALDPADDQQLGELYNHNFLKCLLLLPPAPPATETALLEAVHGIVSKYREKMLSYYVRPRDYEGFADFLQLEGVKLPAVMLFQSQRFDLYRYKPTAEGGVEVREAEALSEWLARFWRQGVRPIFKSQPAFPAVSAPFRQVQALTGESFEEWASNRGRDALIAVTKAGCPHCSKFERPFRELAAELGSSETAEKTGDQFAPLVFGTVDAVYNDLPGALMARVERFPTLLWLPLTAEQPVVVPEEQNPAAVRSFLQAQRTKVAEVGKLAARAVPLWSTLPTELAALAGGGGEAAAEALRGEAEAEAAFEELDRQVSRPSYPFVRVAMGLFSERLLVATAAGQGGGGGGGGRICCEKDEEDQKGQEEREGEIISHRREAEAGGS